ncbi:AraC family transcriptional regulator [Neorhodopirellula lusitana]|uniref:AraC family transcriptional regulator n=1 Tax=Neorhodopirellula lusitana TaxID=445327 RepID=UPI00384F2B9A
MKNLHVGILVETEDTWGRNIVESVCRFGQKEKWTLLIGPRNEQGQLSLPRVWGGDGVIAAFRQPSTVQQLKQLQVPVVDVSSTLKKKDWFARVETDDRARAKMAVEHLVSRGIQHFACYAPSIGRYSDLRATEFKACVESAGYQCAMYTLDGQSEGGWLTNYAKAGQWLAKLPRPLGVFAGDPYPARQLIEICALDGIRIPDDVAILSGDDDELLCNVATPQISSIELASHRIGETAAKLLKRLMSGAQVSLHTRSIPPLRIRARQSTNLLAIDDPELVRMLRTIREHAKDGISVAEVANACCVSRRTLEQKFKEQLGRTPGEEIRRTKFENVRRLLLDTDKSIESIAYDSGFASGASLSQAFQKYFNETPGEYRRSR